jgi:broad specificity phosphatase PhoE
MLHLIRHAESLFNAGDRTTRDCGLSESGIQQASSLYGDYDIVITSNLKRTAETLQRSNITARRVIHPDLFREQIGDSICDHLEEENGTYRETDEQMAFRMDTAKRFIRVLLTQNPNYKIAIITHAFFICHFVQQGLMICNCQVIPYNPSNL